MMKVKNILMGFPPFRNNSVRFGNLVRSRTGIAKYLAGLLCLILGKKAHSVT